ncbi:hypothetical protein HU200_065719 [Digitaria exilis]|uniref:F-box domain-containing protein n=1 Tax=Digitaria exilis TaxID=1010633 RepID=A0A835DXQ3_9POAL|nr:hypothetical protein HU200_065719 [Digitaria exilis]
MPASNNSISRRRRLRLVCRHWRSVIDDRTPATQAQPMVLAFVVGRGAPRAYVLDDLTGHETRGSRELKLPRGATEQGVSMVGTCNGLVCLRRRRGDFVVVNLVTGEKLAVPPPSTRPMEYGDRSWREVPVPLGTSCHPSFGLASVDGATYWVADDTHTVMSLDLKDERVVFVATPLPVRVVLFMDLSWHLTTDLRGRLVFAVCSYETMKPADTVLLPVVIQTKVWMLEDGGRNEKQPTWVLQCKVVEPIQKPPQGIARPAGLHTFAYVETTEPLAFNGGNDRDIGHNEEWGWRFDAGERQWKLMPHTIS